MVATDQFQVAKPARRFILMCARKRNERLHRYSPWGESSQSKSDGTPRPRRVAVREYTVPESTVQASLELGVRSTGIV